MDVAYASVIQLHGLIMEIVALPVQLTAQTSSADEVTDLSAVLSETLGKGLPQDIFAALLAQQMGSAGADPLQQTVVGVGDTERNDAGELTAEQASLLAGQLGLPGLVAISSAPGQQQVASVQDAAGVNAQDAAGVNAADVAGVNAKEILAAGRQPVAATSAVLAETMAIDMPTEGGKVADLQPGQYSFANPVTVQTAGPNIPAPAPVATPQIAQAIPQPVSSPAWGDTLGDRVMWMVGQQHQGAELHLNPPSLGPLEVRLSISDGQANLTFSTQHLPVREAIEAATPRLRDMLGESGITLGSVSVNVGSFTQQQPGEQREAARLHAWSPASPEGDFSSLLPSSVTPLGRNGMVDIFA